MTQPLLPLTKARPPNAAGTLAGNPLRISSKSSKIVVGMAYRTPSAKAKYSLAISGRRGDRLNIEAQ